MLHTAHLPIGHEGVDLGDGDFLAYGGEVQIDGGGLQGAVLVPLAASHVHEHAPGIDVADLEIECLLQAESQGIHGPKETLHGRLADGVDELIDFRDRQHGGELDVLRDSQLAERGPVLGTRVRVEKLETGISNLQ